MITKHGAYIDGFAAPQARDHTDVDAAKAACAARLVLHSRPRFLTKFWLCDKDKRGVALLNEIRAQSPDVRGRKIQVLHGDFNKMVDSILASGDITEKTASFCLLDQRTFECSWETVQKLAAHKKEGLKIELFYFLGSSWLDRAIGGTKHVDKLARWWGSEAWDQLLNRTSHDRADLLRRRFLDELGYRHAFVWPIYEDGEQDGRVVYHMIHCSDHDRASELMHEAYRKISQPESPPQPDLFPDDKRRGSERSREDDIPANAR